MNTGTRIADAKVMIAKIAEVVTQFDTDGIIVR